MTTPFADTHLSAAMFRGQVSASVPPVRHGDAKPVPQRVALLEYLATSDARVDRAAGVIRSVKILGLVSRNGRHYTPQAMARAAGLYEGVRVNVNHSRQAELRGERSVADRFGVLRNVRCLPEGLFADLHYLRRHPLAEMILEAAERMPSALGLSHNAAGLETIHQGQRRIEAITEVRSVDLVSDPASTTGLFESRQQDATAHQAAPGTSTAPQRSLPMLLALLRRGPRG